MKTIKLAVFLKLVRINSISLIFLFIINIFFSCSAYKSTYPEDWAPTEEDIPLESYSGQYNVLLLSLLRSDSYKQEYLNNCLVDFCINDNLEIKFRLKCKDDKYSKNNTIFSLVDPNKKVEIKKEKNGILINYRDFKGDAWGFESIREYVLLSKSKDGSLIIKKGKLSYGAIFWFIPAECKEEYVWYRFTGDAVEIWNEKQQ